MPISVQYGPISAALNLAAQAGEGENYWRRFGAAQALRKDDQADIGLEKRGKSMEIQSAMAGRRLDQADTREQDANVYRGKTLDLRTTGQEAKIDQGARRLDQGDQSLDLRGQQIDATASNNATRNDLTKRGQDMTEQEKSDDRKQRHDAEHDRLETSEHVQTKREAKDAATEWRAELKRLTDPITGKPRTGSEAAFQKALQNYNYTMTLFESPEARDVYHAQLHAAQRGAGQAAPATNPAPQAGAPAPAHIVEGGPQGNGQPPPGPTPSPGAAQATPPSTGSQPKPPAEYPDATWDDKHQMWTVIRNGRVMGVQ